jgi:hypothetical protein
VYIFFTTWEAPELSTNVLILLGISIGTTAGSKLVEQNKTSLKYVPKLAKGNLFRDILSDKDGLSMSRFQMVVWTIIMGLMFLATVVVDLKMMVIDNTMLTLMGISSATFVGLKIPENSKDPMKATPADNNAGGNKAVG